MTVRDNGVGIVYSRHREGYERAFVPAWGYARMGRLCVFDSKGAVCPSNGSHPLTGMVGRNSAKDQSSLNHAPLRGALGRGYLRGAV